MSDRPYQAILDDLLAATDASRATLRLDTPGMNFPAVAESLAAGIKPIISDQSLDQRGAATAQRLFATQEPLIQDDCMSADPPPPRALIEVYGVHAQMLGPITSRDGVIGWISVHYCPSVRHWREQDITALQTAMTAVQQHLEESEPTSLRTSHAAHMRFIEVAEGVRLHTLDQGEGNPIVLLHGWGSSSELWRHQVDDLAQDFRVIAPDLRGFGLSSRASGQLTLDMITDDVKKLLQVLDLKDVCLVGWSMGGLTVMNYCERFDDRHLGRICIADVSPRLRPGPDWPIGVGVSAEIGGSLERWQKIWSSDPQSVLGELTTLAFADKARHETDIAWLDDEAKHADPLAMELFADFFAHDFRPTLQRIALPTLLLYGRHSTSTTPALGEYMANAVKRSTLVMFEDSGHALMVEETAKFNRILRDFAGAE